MQENLNERPSSPTHEGEPNNINNTTDTTEPVQLGAAPLLGPDGFSNDCETKRIKDCSEAIALVSSLFLTLKEQGNIADIEVSVTVGNIHSVLYYPTAPPVDWTAFRNAVPIKDWRHNEDGSYSAIITDEERDRISQSHSSDSTVHNQT